MTYSKKTSLQERESVYRMYYENIDRYCPVRVDVDHDDLVSNASTTMLCAKKEVNQLNVRQVRNLGFRPVDDQKEAQALSDDEDAFEYPK